MHHGGRISAVSPTPLLSASAITIEPLSGESGERERDSGMIPNAVRCSRSEVTVC
jgi:hypothetical protein